MVMGWEMQHLNLALRTVLVISISAISNILTTSLKVGRASGFASQQRVMTSARAGRQSCGTVGRTPLLTTANAAWTAVMLAKGSMPVTSSHNTMPKLYTSTFWVYGLCCIISLKYMQLRYLKKNPLCCFNITGRSQVCTTGFCTYFGSYITENISWNLDKKLGMPKNILVINIYKMIFAHIDCMLIIGNN